MSKNLVTAVVERKERVSDGAGGYTFELRPIEGSPFSARLIRPIRNWRPEYLSKEPGDMLINRLVVALPAHATNVRVDDIVTVDGTSYLVIDIRKYSRSVQCGLKVVH